MFLFVGAGPDSDWLADCGVKTGATGFVCTGGDLSLQEYVRGGSGGSERRPMQLETTMSGVFAIGDARAGSFKRVAAGVGEGAAVVAQLHTWLAAGRARRRLNALVKAAHMRLPAWHRSKIVCTLGPATDPPGALSKLIDAGMDVARVNFSHGTHEDHLRRIAAVRAAAEEAGQPVAILADLPGPKFRLAEITAGERTLHDGEQVALAAEPGGAKDLSVRTPEILRALAPGERVFLADGAVELRVVAPHPTRVACEVVVGGTVRSGSGINVPDAELGSVVPTEADRRHLAFALAQGVEWIGVSFVQSADDLLRVRACMPATGRALLMAKIEKRRAVRDLDAVVAAADGVMVARGDLGVETDLAEIALLQKRIIAMANAHFRPVVTATQMLESMIEHERPTRAEVTDVANAVLDGTDAVMLSGETAIGRYPAAAVEMLNRVLRATENEYAVSVAAERLRTASPREEQALSFVACQLAQRIGARAIVAPVHDVAAAATLAGFRPLAPIIVPAEDAPLVRSLAMVRGIVPLHVAASGDLQHIAAARAWLEGRALAKTGDPLVMFVGPATLQVVRL